MTNKSKLMFAVNVINDNKIVSQNIFSNIKDAGKAYADAILKYNYPNHSNFSQHDSFIYKIQLTKTVANQNTSYSWGEISSTTTIISPNIELVGER